MSELILTEAQRAFLALDEELKRVAAELSADSQWRLSLPLLRLQRILLGTQKRLCASGALPNDSTFDSERK